MKSRIRLLAGSLPLLIILAAALLVRDSEPVTYFGTLVEPTFPAKDFTLQSADGDVSLSDFRGRHVVLFFGYTSCPDVCPMTLARVTAAARAVGPEAEEEVQVVLITVDPERDSPARMAEYTRAFGPNVIGLSGSPEDIASVASAYGIHYAKAEGSSETGYLVDHSATVTVIDREGGVRLLWSPMHGVDELESDIRALLRS